MHHSPECATAVIAAASARLSSVVGLQTSCPGVDHVAATRRSASHSITVNVDFTILCQLYTRVVRKR